MKICNAFEIFDLFQEIAFSSLEPERIRRELVKRGKEKKDIELSLRLMASIVGLNLRVFPFQNISADFISEKVCNDLVSAYCGPPFASEEGYVVWVEGISEYVIKRTKIGLILINNDGDIVDNCEDGFFPTSFPMVQEVLLGLALHEVRHRFQRNNKFELFSPEDIDDIQYPLKGYIDFVDYYQSSREKIFREEGKTQEFIEKRINPWEFDALVIANFLMAKIHRGITIEELLETVTLTKGGENG